MKPSLRPAKLAAALVLLAAACLAQGDDQVTESTTSGKALAVVRMRRELYEEYSRDSW